MFLAKYVVADRIKTQEEVIMNSIILIDAPHLGLGLVNHSLDNTKNNIYILESDQFSKITSNDLISFIMRESINTDRLVIMLNADAVDNNIYSTIKRIVTDYDSDLIIYRRYSPNSISRL